MTDHPLVYPNPFTALDEHGIPAGTFPFAPEHANGSRRWIGASIASAVLDPKDLAGKDAIPTAKIGKGATAKTEYVGRLPSQRTCWAFNLSPQPVLNIKHYRDAIAHGDLFAADEASARALGVPATVAFVEPKAALAEACKRAVAAWQDQHGRPPPFTHWPENLRPDAELPLPETSTASTAITAGDEK